MGNRAGHRQTRRRRDTPVRGELDRVIAALHQSLKSPVAKNNRTCRTRAPYRLKKDDLQPTEKFVDEWAPLPLIG
jgi:hypothetical protein